MYVTLFCEDDAVEIRHNQDYTVYFVRVGPLQIQLDPRQARILTLLLSREIDKSRLSSSIVHEEAGG